MSEEQLKIIQIKKKNGHADHLSYQATRLQHYSGFCIYVLVILMRKKVLKMANDVLLLSLSELAHLWL